MFFGHEKLARSYQGTQMEESNAWGDECIQEGWYMRVGTAIFQQRCCEL